MAERLQVSIHAKRGDFRPHQSDTNRPLSQTSLSTQQMKSKAFFRKGSISETDKLLRCMFIFFTSNESGPVDVDCLDVFRVA
jgi:hypothetical protein